MEERKERHGSWLEVVELEVRLQLLPSGARLLGLEERRAEEQDLALGRPERPAQTPPAHQASRRRSSACFRTCRYCGLNARSRMPLFSAWRRRSRTTAGGTTLRRPASRERAYQSTPIPTFSSVENSPTRKNASRF